MDHDTVTGFEKPADNEHQDGLLGEIGSDAVGAVIKDVTGKLTQKMTVSGEDW